MNEPTGDPMSEPTTEPTSEPAAGPPALSSTDGRIPVGDHADRPARVTSDHAAGRGRPLIERIGMVGIALVLAALFGGVAVAAFSGGEPFLGVMAAIGCLMTLWAGALTLFRG